MVRMNSDELNFKICLDNVKKKETIFFVLQNFPGQGNGWKIV